MPLRAPRPERGVSTVPPPELKVKDGRKDVALDAVNSVLDEN